MSKRIPRDDDASRVASDAALGTRESPYLSFRCPEPLVKRLDECVTRWREHQLGVNITRSDVVRALLARALDAEETRTSGSDRPLRRKQP